MSNTRIPLNIQAIAHNKNAIKIPDSDKNTVLYFYPKDDTPGCTIEAQTFTKYVEDFNKLNYQIVGISKDDNKSHCKFSDKYDLKINLLSDEDGVICEKFGVIVEKNMYGKKYMGIERTTFLIDQNGTILKVWNKVKVEGHAEEVLAAARGIK